MCTIRVFEDRVNQEMASGDIPGAVHLYAGQEASAVGVCMHLDDGDKIASTHRGHGHCIAKGCDVDGMMAEIFGKETGICLGKGGSMHIADLSKGMMGANGIVGGGPPLICGAALTCQVPCKTGGVADRLPAGDGASNQGTTWRNRYNLAKVWQFAGGFRRRGQRLCGEATSSDDAPGPSAAASSQRAEPPSACRAKQVDGLDFFAVYEAAKEPRSTGPAAGDGPSPVCTSRLHALFRPLFEGDAQTYRAAWRDGKAAAMRRDQDCLQVFPRQRVTETGLLEGEHAGHESKRTSSELIDLKQLERNRKAPRRRIRGGGLLTDVYVSY